MRQERLLLAIDAMCAVNANPGQILIEQGEAADCMFLVESGEFVATVEAEDGSRIGLNAFTSGSYFGEMALMCVSIA